MGNTLIIVGAAWIAFNIVYAIAMTRYGRQAARNAQETQIW